MQKTIITFRPSQRGQSLPLRHQVISLMRSIGESYIDLHPIQGLFENTIQGYRAEFHAANTNDTIDIQSADIFNAAHQLLSQGKQGSLFVRVTMHTLCSPCFIDQLKTGMQHTPGLHHRLVLLLQAEDLYPDSNHERSIALSVQTLATAGIQLGIEVKNGRLACLNSNYIEPSSSPCILIHYSDDWVQQQSNMDLLRETIRNCRSKGWPLWLDHGHHETSSSR